MKKTIFLTVFLCLFISCEKKDNTCNCDNPIEDLQWLKDLKNSITNCTCQQDIIQATYNKQTVFYSTMTDPLCDGYYPVVLFDCTGTSVKVFEPPLGESFGNQVTDRETLYSCKTKK